MPRPRFLLLVLVTALAASCTSDATPETTTTTEATTTTTSTTTTSTTTTLPEVDDTTIGTYPPEVASPINGLPIEDDELRERRGLAVKIDNHALARPQSGIQHADGMIETIVEGGLTRFIALFHGSDANYIGPIRSLRPTDTALIAAMDAPIAISGGQPWVQSLAATRGVQLIGETEGYFRVGGRRAPHNLFSDTEAVRRTADSRGWSDEQPRPLFDIDVWEIPDAVATEITLDWSPGTDVRWEWDEEQQLYTRWIGDTPHEWVDEDGEFGQITTEVLIVVAGNQVFVSGSSGSSVPAIETLGSGQAWVFAVGRVWEGTWERSLFEESYRLFELDGTPAAVPTGLPWISVFPAQRTVTFDTSDPGIIDE